MKARIIFDFDDAIYTVQQTDNVVVRKKRLRMNRLINVIKLSECICVVNTYTKKFASQYNKNISIISTPIDCKGYFPKKSLTQTT